MNPNFFPRLIIALVAMIAVALAIGLRLFLLIVGDDDDSP